MNHSLFLDTSTPSAYLAVRRDDGRSFAATIAPGRRHGCDLLPSIRDLLVEAAVKPADLGAIRVGLGPGSYTGLRVGVTAAKTLAYATGAGLIGFNSLEFFALAAPDHARRVVAISDAQRGDFHVAEFGRAAALGPLVELGRTAIASEAELRDRLSARPNPDEGPTYVVGPGLDRWTGDWPEGSLPLAGSVPSPLAMLQIVAQTTMFEGLDGLSALEPIYLRRSAAEDQWEKRPK